MYYPIKFSRKTPKKMEEGYRKLWDPSRPEGEGCPSSKRIIQDIHRVVFESYPALYNARGIALQHIARRTGRRRKETEASSTGSVKSRGGKRVKGEDYDVNDIWIHESVGHLLGEGVQESVNRFKNLPQNSEFS